LIGGVEDVCDIGEVTEFSLGVFGVEQIDLYVAYRAAGLTTAA
jgi:hypothetical protein